MADQQNLPVNLANFVLEPMGLTIDHLGHLWEASIRGDWESHENPVAHLQSIACIIADAVHLGIQVKNLDADEVRTMQEMVATGREEEANALLHEILEDQVVTEASDEGDAHQALQQEDTGASQGGHQGVPGVVREADTEVRVGNPSVPKDPTPALVVGNKINDVENAHVIPDYLGPPHMDPLRLPPNARARQDQMEIWFPEGRHMFPKALINITEVLRHNLPDEPCAFLHMASLHQIRPGYDGNMKRLISDEIRRTNPRFCPSLQPCVRSISKLANYAMKGYQLPHLPSLVELEAYLNFVLFVSDGKFETVRRHFIALSLSKMLDYKERIIVDERHKLATYASTGERLPVSVRGY